MPNWLNFATVSGAVTVIAFIAECLKAFPKFAEFRRGFLLVSFGFFVGSLLTASSGAMIVLSPDGSPLVLLMAICIGLALLFLFLAVMSEDDNRKGEFYGLLAFFVAGFLLLLAIYGMSRGGSGSSLDKSDLSFREQVWLGERALTLGDDERAIQFWESASYYLPSEDPRVVALRKKIAAAKERQLSRDIQSVN
jgi:peptidoglycan/LPS O-acetylase OafA/YrhL